MNDPQNIDDELQRRLHSIFPDEVVASRIVDAVCNTRRPRTWSRKANAPYYKHMYGLWIRNIIDRMILTKESLLFEESTSGMTKNTLYLKIYQAIRFLIENLDDDLKYTKWWDEVQLRYLEPQRAWRLSYVEQAETINTTPTFKAPIHDIPIWKRRVDKYLESSETKPFVLEGLCLDQQQVLELKRELATLKGIEYSINTMAIRIIRTRE